MSRLHRIVWIVAAFLSLGCTSGSAQDLAPPSGIPPGRVPPVPEPIGTTADVQVPIGEPVIELLREWTAREGHPFHADQGLGERRIHLFPGDAPVEQLRQAVAPVVGGVWAASPGSAGFELRPDPSSEKEISAIVDRRRARFVAGIQRVGKLLSAPPSEVARLRREDPYAAVQLTRPDYRAALRVAMALSRQQWSALVERSQLRLSSAELGPGGKALIREFTREMNRLIRGTGGQVESLDERETERNGLELTISQDWNGMPFGYLHVHLSTGSGGGAVGISGSDPMATRWLDLSGKGADGSPSVTKVTLRFPKAARGWGDTLAALAAQVRLPIVAEDRTQTGPRPPAFPSTWTGRIDQALDRACVIYGYQWRFHDGVYQIRSATWYADREREPPGTLVKAARAARLARRGLGLNWLSEAASLPLLRWQRLWIHAPDAIPVMTESAPLLRLYGSLSNEQRAVAASGLETRVFSPDQQRALLAVLTHPVSRPQLRGSPDRLRVLVEPVRVRFLFEAPGETAEAALTLPEFATPATERSR